MEFLNEYMIPEIVGICLVVGYIIKHWIKDADNKKLVPIEITLGQAARGEY